MKKSQLNYPTNKSVFLSSGGRNKSFFLVTTNQLFFCFFFLNYETIKHKVTKNIKLICPIQWCESIKHFMWTCQALQELYYWLSITLLLIIARRWRCARRVPTATWLWRLKYLQCVHLFLALLHTCWLRFSFFKYFLLFLCFHVFFPTFLVFDSIFTKLSICFVSSSDLCASIRCDVNHTTIENE